MTKLVKRRARTLDETKTALLLDEIKASEKVDRHFFDQGISQRRKLAGLHFDDVSTRKTKFNRKLEAKIAVNLVHAHIRSLLPTVFFKEPTVKARPMNALQAGKEETWELVLNNTLRRNGYKAETKAAILDALTYHEGWKKVGFNIPEEPEQDYEGEGGGEGSEEVTQGVRGPTPWGSKQIPISMRVSPLNVIVDYLAPGRCPNHARFVAIKYIRPLSEMKADDRYENLETINKQELVRSGSINKRMNETTNLAWENLRKDTGGPGVDMVIFYECYVYQYVDLKLYRQVVWVAEGVKKPIRMATWEELFGVKLPGWPVHRIVFNPVPDDYPMAEVEVWQQLQEAINWTVSKLVTFVSQGNQRILVDPTKLLDAKKARAKLLSGQAVEVIETKGTNNVQEAVQSMQGNPVPADVYRLIDVLVTFVERTSQLSQNRQLQGGVFRTATEAEFVEQSTAIRDDERVDIVRDFLVNDVRKIAAIIRNTVDTELVVQLAGDLGRVSWERFQPRDIEWEPDIQIEVDSFRQLSKQQEMVKWLQVFNIAQGIFPIMPNVVRLDVIFMELLKSADVPDPELIMGNLQGAREVQLFEVMMMMLGEQVIPQENEPHGEHIAALENLMNSPIRPVLEGSEAWNMILEHMAAHEEYLTALREAGQSASVGQNPGDLIGGGNGDLAGNQQRSQAGLLREAARTGGRAQEEFL
jgi:hypothetical protein